MKKNNKNEIYYLIPIILIVTIVPLIVRLRVIPLSGAAYNFWNGETVNYDFFSYNKMVWIIIFTIFAMISFGTKLYKEGYEAIGKTYFYIPMAIYSVAVIISTMVSKYKEIALGGFVDRYEGMYVLLAYMIILFVTMNLLKDESHAKTMLYAIFILLTINCTIGIFQYIGYDLWKTSFGKSLMLPREYKKYADSLNFNFMKHEIYSTLYNTNYVGSLMAMLVPLSTTMLILEKNRRLKVISAIMVILSVVNLIGSNARSGIVGCTFAFIVLIVMLNRYIIARWKSFTVITVCIILLVLGINTVSKGAVYKRVTSIKTEIIELVSKTKASRETADEWPLKSFKVNENIVEMVINKDTLKIAVREGQINFSDENNRAINLKFDNNTGKIELLDKRYNGYLIQIGDFNDQKILQISYGILNFTFKLLDNSITLIDNKGNVISLKPVETFGFKGLEDIGSGRGYIWSRSIPLLKNTLLIGYGPDTFAAYFPQNEFRAKLHYPLWQIIDKPHNYYLQTAINTGVISLIALLVLFSMYFASSAKIYIKNRYDNFNSIVGLGMFVAVFGYVIAAVFNDSIVSVAPVFWVILGMGISVNRMVIKK